MKTELNYESVKSDAKAMKARLNELGFPVKNSQVLEALASAYGFKSWHVLRAEIKARTEIPKIVVKNPIKLYVECYNTDEYAANILDWIMIELNQSFIDNLLKHRKNAEVNHISVNVSDEWPDEIADTEGSSICYSNMIVWPTTFWHELSDKYESGNNEYGGIPIDLVLELVQAEDPTKVTHEYFEVDKSFYDPSNPIMLVGRNGTSDLIEFLQTDGILPDGDESDAEDN